MSNKKIERIGIRINDYPKKNFDDELVCGEMVKEANSAKPRMGRVRIHERRLDEDGGKKLYLVEDINNLIVYRGRNWLAQRAFNTNLTNRPYWKDKYISWLAIGTGGAVVGQPLTPTSPVLEDCALNAHGTVGGDRCVTVNSKDYHAIDISYPKFLHDPDVTETLCSDCSEQDSIDLTTYRCDQFLIGLVRTTIVASEANGISPATYQDISEAGLFVSPSNDLTYSFAPTDMQLFARVCFSTIRKQDSRELIFSWYIYF